MKKLYALIVVFALPILIFTWAYLSAQTQTTSAQTNLVIHNTSDYTIQHLYVSSVASHHWRTDLLPQGQIIEPQQKLQVTVLCNQYDVKLVDKAGDEIEFYGVWLCADNNQVLVFDGKTLEKK